MNDAENEHALVLIVQYYSTHLLVNESLVALTLSKETLCASLMIHVCSLCKMLPDNPYIHMNASTNTNLSS